MIWRVPHFQRNEPMSATSMNPGSIRWSVQVGVHRLDAAVMVVSAWPSRESRNEMMNLLANLLVEYAEF